MNHVTILHSDTICVERLSVKADPKNIGQRGPEHTIFNQNPFHLSLGIFSGCPHVITTSRGEKSKAIIHRSDQAIYYFTSTSAIPIYAIPVDILGTDVVNNKILPVFPNSFEDSLHHFFCLLFRLCLSVRNTVQREPVLVVYFFECRNIPVFERDQACSIVYILVISHKPANRRLNLFSLDRKSKFTFQKDTNDGTSFL